MLKTATLSVLALLATSEARQVPIREVMELYSDEFDDNMIKELLVRKDINHLMLSDINKLIAKLADEFPEFITLGTIGESWEGRQLNMLTLDWNPDGEPLKKKPAMFLAGAHHAREFMSMQLPLYSILRMIHGALFKKDERYIHLLKTNRYFVIPVVNVDGLADIEKTWVETGEMLIRRKNMNPHFYDQCEGENRGVDLNRNYAEYFYKPGGNSPDPCAESYRGTHPFSEPETRAVRDFMRAHREDIKFAYNFHSYGNMYLWPYNGSSPNNLGERNPDVLKVFEEIWDGSTFPEGTLHGNAWEALHYTSSGEQSDWILGELGIPSICPEVGSSDFFSYMWNIPFRKVVTNILEENINWIENTFVKIGNEISVSPVGYKLLGDDNKAILYFKIQNNGLSDLLAENLEIKLGDNVKVLSKDNKFVVDTLGKRSSKVESVPVEFIGSS